MRLIHHPALHAGELIDFLARRAVPGVEEVVDGCTGGACPTGASSRSRRTPMSRGMPAPRGRSCASTPTRTRSRRRSAAIRARPARPRGARSPRPRPPRPRRACRARAARPADLRRRGAHARRPPDRGARRAAGRPRRRRHAPLPRAGRAGGARPGDAADAARPRPRARAPGRRAGRRRAGRRAPPGIGPWTTAYVALRSGDDDAFLPTDLGVKHGLAALGADPAGRRSWPRRGGRTAASPSRTCGRRRLRRDAARGATA